MDYEGAAPAARKNINNMSWTLLKNRGIAPKIYMPRRKIGVKNVQAKDSTDEQAKDSTKVQSLASKNNIFQCYADPWNAKDTSDNGFKLVDEKDHQTNGGFELKIAQNDLNVAQNADINKKEAIDTSNIQDDLSTMEKVDTEVVWVPVSSPRRQLQEFLDFSTELDEVAPSVCSSDGESNASKFDDIPQKNKSIEPSTHTNNRENFESIQEKRFHVTRMELCEEWLKYSEAIWYEKECRLRDYISTVVNLDTVVESQKTIKNIITDISFQILKMWNNSGRNPKVLYTKYSDWFQQPPIKFTSIFAQSKMQKLPETKAFISPEKVVKTYSSKQLPANPMRMNLETNADLFMFLKRSIPPFNPEMLFDIITSMNNYLTEDNKSKIRKFCQSCVSDMKFKWMTADFNEEIFQSKFAFWLALSVRWPAFIKPIYKAKNLQTHKTAENTETSQQTENPINLTLNTLEHALAKKCNEIGHMDVSHVIHRLIHHPEDAARMRVLMSESKCSFEPQTLVKKSESSNMSLETENGTERCKSMERDEITEGDPLKLESESDSSDEPEEVTDNSFPALSPSKEQSQRLYKVSGTHRTALMQVLQKLKGKTTEKVTRPTQPSDESNDTVLVPTEKSEKTPSSCKKELEFGPVLDRLIFTCKKNLKNGSKVSMKNGIATVIKVSNLTEASVLLPISHMKKKVHAPNIKNGVSSQAPPHNIKDGTKLLTSPTNGITTLDTPTKNIQNKIIVPTYSENRTRVLASPTNIEKRYKILGNRTRVQASPTNIEKRFKILVKPYDIQKRNIVLSTPTDIENTTKLLASTTNSEKKIQILATPYIIRKRNALLGTQTKMENSARVLASATHINTTHIKNSYPVIETPSVFSISHNNSEALKMQKTPINVKNSVLKQLKTNACNTAETDPAAPKNTFILPPFKRWHILKKSPVKRYLSLVSQTSEEQPLKKGAAD